MEKNVARMMPCYTVDGKKYYSVRTFARLVNKTPSSVRMLLCKGNKIRKLKHIKIGGTTLIPVTEYTEFPFTFMGRYTPESECYFFNEDGETVVRRIEK